MVRTACVVSVHCMHCILHMRLTVQISQQRGAFPFVFTAFALLILTPQRWDMS